MPFTEVEYHNDENLPQAPQGTNPPPPPRQDTVHYDTAADVTTGDGVVQLPTVPGAGVPIPSDPAQPANTVRSVTVRVTDNENNVSLARFDAAGQAPPLQSLIWFQHDPAQTHGLDAAGNQIPGQVTQLP